MKKYLQTFSETKDTLPQRKKQSNKHALFSVLLFFFILDQIGDLNNWANTSIIQAVVESEDEPRTH